MTKAKDEKEIFTKSEKIDQGKHKAAGNRESRILKLNRNCTQMKSQRSKIRT